MYTNHCKRRIFFSGVPNQSSDFRSNQFDIIDPIKQKPGQQLLFLLAS